jgi:hypothetical protein
MEQFDGIYEALVTEVAQSGITECARARYEKAQTDAAATFQGDSSMAAAANLLSRLQDRLCALEQTYAELVGAQLGRVNDVVAGTETPADIAGAHQAAHNECVLVNESILHLVTTLIPRADIELKIATAKVQRNTVEVVKAAGRLAIFNHLSGPGSQSSGTDGPLQGLAYSIAVTNFSATFAEEYAATAQNTYAITQASLRRAGIKC